jgi:transcriptional regulator with XRE-family HTH domain
MIRNETDYQEAIRRLAQDRDVASRQRAVLQAQGFSADDVERGMEPLLSFQQQLAEEVAWYENVRRGNIPTIRRLTDMGRLLIALRIASGFSQRQLAEKLNVTEAVVSRDERNEYHGISVERAQRILDALGVTTATSVDELVIHREPVSEGLLVPA